MNFSSTKTYNVTLDLTEEEIKQIIEEINQYFMLSSKQGATCVHPNKTLELQHSLIFLLNGDDAS